MANGVEREFRFPVWGTQGGGLVRAAGNIYIFVEAPDPSTGLEIGDTMPEIWGVVPANELAREEMLKAEFDDEF